MIQCSKKLQFQKAKEIIENASKDTADKQDLFQFIEISKKMNDIASSCLVSANFM